MQAGRQAGRQVDQGLGTWRCSQGHLSLMIRSTGANQRLACRSLDIPSACASNARWGIDKKIAQTQIPAVGDPKI